jgi:hypothetical protein
LHRGHQNGGVGLGCAGALHHGNTRGTRSRRTIRRALSRSLLWPAPPRPHQPAVHHPHSHSDTVVFVRATHTLWPAPAHSPRPHPPTPQDGMEAELMGLTTEDLETKARLLSNQNKVCTPNPPCLVLARASPTGHCCLPMHSRRSLCVGLELTPPTHKWRSQQQHCS